MRFQDEACIRERDGPEGFCNTDVCVEASKRILTSMKRGIDPCKDFYKFACGGFRDQQPYQPSASFNILQTQIDEHIHSERFAQFSILHPFLISKISTAIISQVSIVNFENFDRFYELKVNKTRSYPAR